jgi:hypothetical protein
MKKYLFAFITMVMIFSCSTKLKFANTENTPEQEIYFPEIGIVTKVNIGEYLVDKEIGRFRKDLIIKTSLLNGVVSKGAYVPYATVEGEFEVYTPKNNATNAFKNYKNISANKLYIYVEKTGEVGLAKLSGNKLDKLEVFKGTDFEFKNTLYSTEYLYSSSYNTTKDFFKQTLVYNGLQGNIIKLSYREFINNIAREAYTADIVFDLDLTKTISYKNCQIEIIDITPNNITYKVLKHF